MIFNQDFSLKKAPPNWFWSGVFLLSLAGLSYLGLNPYLIENWWWVLVTYNLVMGIIAAYYIFCAVSRLKKEHAQEVIGARFTWSFVKIIPLLVLVPVLSFYLFSFQTVRDNVARSHQTYNEFNQTFLQQINSLYQGAQVVRNERYVEHTKILLGIIGRYSDFQKESKTYNQMMQAFVDSLVDKGWACYISLNKNINSKEELVAKTSDDTCVIKDTESPVAKKIPIKIADNLDKLFEIGMSTVDKNTGKKQLSISAVYPADQNLLRFVTQVKEMANFAKNIRFEVNTSLTEKRFMLDFSSTILLTILSVLLVVFKMINQLMRPMHNLSMATREIAKGNYDVLVETEENNQDMRQLIGKFNEMSRQIKRSREGLDTHNLYLETILKYSYGVIGLDKKKNIRLINPVIGNILMIDNEQQFIGKLCEEISKQYAYLEPLFSMAAEKFKQGAEWSEEIELSLSKRNILLICQGAVLDSSDETLGYVIIIQDISKLSQAQKKAAWGEVAVRMAHEIKNPLTPILLSAQRLRNKFLSTLKGKELAVIDKATGVIIEQVKSMDAMVSAFADYANMPQVERKPLDLNALIRRSIALYDAQDNINIEFDLEKGVPKLSLDASSISRVLINLVKNAAESVKNTQSLTVKISTKFENGIVRLSIEDNGSGFAKAVLKHMFEPYVTTKVKGSGLGMAIVYNTIEQHGARIFANNVTPHGAIVTIEFDEKSPPEAE